MRRQFFLIPLFVLVLLASSAVLPVFAQEDQPEDTQSKLMLYTSYPSQVVGIGDVINMSLKLTSGSAEVVDLEMKKIPDQWIATFRGGGDIVQSVYVQPDQASTVDLRLEQPTDVTAGSYEFVVLAKGENESAELQIRITLKDKLPPKLTLSCELPTLKGNPDSNFRYSVTLKNEGDEDLNVNLTATSSNVFITKITLTGQEVTDIPINAQETKTLSIEATPIGTITAGTYPITVYAQGGDVQSTLELAAEVTGQSKLSISSPDGRLSGQAYAGKESPLKVVVKNTGSAPAQGITMSSTEPTGWKIEFEPQTIESIDAGKQVEITVNITPAEKAVSGDYVITLNAKPAQGTTQSSDFRITVLTSTVWGITGILLIAVALGVVAIAVLRYGRR